MVVNNIYTASGEKGQLIEAERGGADSEEFPVEGQVAQISGPGGKQVDEGPWNKLALVGDKQGV